MANDGVPVTSVRAVYAFKGKNNDELNLKKGDLITVTQMPDGGWWEGTLNGVTGWFPSNYVKEYRGGPLVKYQVLCFCEPTAVEKKSVKSSGKALNNVFSRQETSQVYRKVVLKDIIDSERTNLNDLMFLRDTYLLSLQACELLSAEEFRTLVGNLDDVVDIHTKLLMSLEDCYEVPSNRQRIGAIFMHLAPILKAVHLGYCSNHAFAVTVLERHRDNLNLFMESYGSPTPGFRHLTTGLSQPFRRLEKYRGLLLEVERHTEENHVDRGDTQRAVHVYRDISDACSVMRRRKETELEVLHGNILGWEGEDVKNLGDIILMTQVTMVSALRDRRERHLVLFSSTLVFLSVGQTSAFVYEGKLPLTGIEVSRLDETSAAAESYRHAFEISGKMINTIVVLCHGAEELDEWVDTLQQQIAASWASNASPVTVAPPPSASAASKSHVIGGVRSVSTSPVRMETVVANKSPTPFKPANSVWSMSCPRPSPSHRLSGYTPASTAATAVSPTTTLPWDDSAAAAARRAHFNRSFDKKECLLGEDHGDDDGRIRRAKNRYTINSDYFANPLIAQKEKIIDEVTTGDQTVVEEKSLVDTVYALKDQVKELQRDVRLVSEALEEERTKRKRLEDIVRRFHGHEDDRDLLHWNDE